MKRFLTCIALVLVGRRVECGTRVAHPGEEGQALAIWDKYCSNGGDGGVLDGGSVFVHCKHPLTPEARTLQAKVLGQVEGPEKREQIIFVQPPTLNFQHELKVLGGETLEPKTIVYVKPSKSTHRYSANIKVAEGEHKKPELVFLNSDGGQEQPQQQQEVEQEFEEESPVIIGRHVNKRQTGLEQVEQEKWVDSEPFKIVKVVSSTSTSSSH